jgi:tRNA 2-thiouridine synthesizing protein D
VKIGVMILEGPYQHQAVDSAYRFIQAARSRGHEIVGVFLYTDAVNNANRLIRPAGERNLNQMLDELGAQDINIVACGACASFRGLKKEATSDHIRISGLGSLAEYINSADRFITFGD